MGKIVSGIFGGGSSDRRADALDEENIRLKKEQFEREKALTDPALSEALRKYKETGEIDAALYEAMAKSGVDSAEKLDKFAADIDKKHAIGSEGLDKLTDLDKFDALKEGGKYSDAFRQASQQLIDDTQATSDLARREEAARQAFSGTATSDIANRNVEGIERGRSEAIGKLGADFFEKGLNRADTEYNRSKSLSDAYRGVGKEGFADISDIHRAKSDIAKDIAAAPYLGENAYLNTVHGKTPDAPSFDTGNLRKGAAADASRGADLLKLGASFAGFNKGKYVKKKLVNPFKHQSRRKSQ